MSRPRAARSRLGVAITAAVLTVAVVGLAGCGRGDASSGASGGASGGARIGATVPLTRAQASTLAEVLHRNFEAGGAAFTVTALDPATGATVVLDGIVDWVGGQGRAVVTGLRDADGEVTEVAWTREAVAELRPGLAERLAAAGEDPTRTFVLRGVDTTGRTLDRLIAIVLGLATERPDNAQLVLQKPDAGFLRTDELRGTEVEVLRYSERSVLWVDLATGLLLRYEGNDSRGTAPVVVDLLERGPVEVPLPPVSAMGAGSGE